MADPRLVESLALLKLREAIAFATEVAEQAGERDIAKALDDLHQRNEGRIDSDQTQYLIDRGWGDYSGWEGCPDAHMGETLWSGTASRDQLVQWFGEG